MAWDPERRGPWPKTNAGGLPWVYLHKSFILLLVVSLLLQAVAQLLKTLAVLGGVQSTHLPASHEEHL